MIPILAFEVKYYFRSLKEVIQMAGLFMSIILLLPFAQLQAKLPDQAIATASLWIALTVMVALGSVTLFQRDHESGRLEYYQLSKGGLAGVILAKWLAYYLVILMVLAVTLPVAALLVDIPVHAWSHYGLGLAAGAMALSILASLIAALMTGLEKAGAALSLVVLPLMIPVIIFGTGYLAMAGEALFQTGLLFLFGMSLLLLPILCLAGASCIRAAN